MATFIWQGDGAGDKDDWDDGRNWINEAGAAYAVGVYPGVVPAQYDICDFRNAITGTQVSPEPGGYDATGDADIQELLVGPDYNGAICATGTPLTIDIRADGRVVIDGQNALGIYLLGGGGQGLSRTWVLNSKTDCDLDGVVGDLEAQRGNITLPAGVTITTCVFSYVTRKTADAVITIDSGATLPATVTVLGGKISNSADITTVAQSAGEWTNEVGADLTTLSQTGGLFNWDGGDVATINSRSAQIDASRTQNGRTFTTLTAGRGANVNLDDGVGNITLGTIVYEGGSVKFPVSTSLS